MPGSRFPIRIKATPRTAALKEAIVASFTVDSHLARARLAGFDESDWSSVLWWLDISGMAIYFYQRACELGANSLLPRETESGLAQRLGDNRVRIQSLLDESRILSAWFHSGNISYVLLKGFTLVPHSVQETSLRSQADLDFMVADRYSDLAIHFISRLGYRLHAQSGNTLEFRAGAPSVPDLANIYSAKTQRALELHVAKDGTCESQMLSRRVMRELDGTSFYALSSADILIEQARHLLKHLCGEYTRLSWVLEFSRHVVSRRTDADFQLLVQSRAAEITNGNLAMGMALWLAESLFGSTPTMVPDQWRTDALPVRVRLWLERYARTLLLTDVIGNKLYALLRKEVPGSTQQPRSTFQILLPRALPAPILKAVPNETRSEKWARYCVESRFILQRLWFHFREGVRFAIEASRWNREIERIGR